MLLRLNCARFMLRSWQGRTSQSSYNALVVVIIGFSLSVSIGCSDADFDSEQSSFFAGDEAYDYQEDGQQVGAGDDRLGMIEPSSAGATDTLDVGVNMSGATGDGAGESAGEVGGTPCMLNATQQRTDEEESAPLTVCLDDLFSKDDAEVENSDAAPPSEMLSEGDLSQCDQEEALSQTLSAQTGAEISCSDFDRDCYYQCDGWTLPDTLQDADDRRAFITESLDGEESLERESAQTCRESMTNGTSATCCPINQLERSLQESPSSRMLCRIPIPLQEGETLKLMSPCQGHSLMWISEQNESQYLNFVKLEDLNLESTEQISFVPRIQRHLAQLEGESTGESMGPITSAVCHEGQALTALLIDSEGMIFYAGFGNTGRLEIEPLYRGESPLSTPWRAENLSVNDQGLFRWEISTLADSPDPIARYEDHAYGFLTPRRLTPLTEGVSQRVLSCHACDNQGENQLNSATLTAQGEVVITSDFSLDQVGLDEATVRLNPPLGFFDQLTSNAQILAMTSVEEMGVYRASRRVAFSFWSAPELRGQLLHFEASRWGFNEVSVSSIIGEYALLRLGFTRDDTSGVEWGIYQVSTDRLKVINASQILSDYIGVDVAQLKTPTLVENNMLWVNSSESGDSADLIMLELSQ